MHLETFHKDSAPETYNSLQNVKNLKSSAGLRVLNLQPCDIWWNQGNIFEVDLHTLDVCLDAVTTFRVLLQN